MPQTETPVSQLKINRLTKTQFDGASELSETEIYAVDPEFTGGKLLKTDSDGNIVESTATEADASAGGTAIQGIKVNGTELTPDADKKVDVTVPTDTNDLTNGAGYITGITYSDVTAALGYTPYNSTNPSGYQANVIETVKVNGTALTPSSKAVDITVPTDTIDLTNGAGYITSSALTGYATETWVGQQGFLTSTALSGYATEQWVQNQGYLTGITSSDVTTALGYTPYNSSNPNGYITNSALSNYVTTNTTQTITAQKTFKRTETQFQDSVARFVSTYISSTNGWRGRVVIGAKDYTFIIGTYNGMAAIGGHKFTDSSTESGAAWSDIYFQPDGDKAVYIGGYSWTQNSGWFKVQNNASYTGGKVQVNTGSISSANWKDVAYKGENVKDFSFTSISGYNASKTQTLKHINGTLTWVDD